MQRLSSIAFGLYMALTVFAVMAYGTVHQPVIAVFYLFSTIFVILYSLSAFRDQLRISGLLIFSPMLLFALYAFVQSVPIGTVSDSAGIGQIPRTISLEPYHSLAAGVSILILFFVSSSFLGLLGTAARVKKFAVFVTVFGTVYAFYAILQSVLSPDSIYGIYTPAAATPFGSFVNRHNFAAVVEMCIAFPIGLLFSGAVGRDKVLLTVTSIAIMATSLLLSGSRGGLVSLIAMVILVSLISSRSRSGKSVAAKFALSFALLVTAIGGAIFVGGETSLTRIGDSLETEDISSYRMHIWRVTTYVIRDNFPLGAGIGAFHTAYAAKDTSGGQMLVEQAHNDFLQVAADAGVVGIVLGISFLVVFGNAVRKALLIKDHHLRGIAVGAAGACFAVLVHSLFDFVLHITAVALLFLSCLALLTAAVDNSENSPDDDVTHPKKKGSVAPFVR
ncbi:MAG: O-antigen ligase family protein [Acidobacteriota bacterium]|nr:MAG: O-antigen ligase family protein [Acidobacteriota bacterium]